MLDKDELSFGAKVLLRDIEVKEPYAFFNRTTAVMNLLHELYIAGFITYSLHGSMSVKCGLTPEYLYIVQTM